MLHLIFRGLSDSEPAAATAGLVFFGAFSSAFLASALAGMPVIKMLLKLGFTERTEKTPIEDDEMLVDISAKKNIPTMGGVIIGIGLVVGALLWGGMGGTKFWLCVGCFFAMGALGLVDDYLKIKGASKRDRGLKVRQKLALQGAVGIILGLIYLVSARERLVEVNPFLFSNPVIWLAVSALIVALMSNSVNVADGMDGLAGGLSAAALLPLVIMAGFMSPDAGVGFSGIAIFSAVLCGATLGFIWHNTYPARVFMGDTGALAIGGGLGLAVLLSGYVILLPLLAFVFLAEFTSSVVQVLVFKATGRRVFPVAPLHHIFQKKKWPESHTVTRFWIVGIIGSMAAPALAAYFTL